jgi:hypothetical protein
MYTYFFSQNMPIIHLFFPATIASIGLTTNILTLVIMLNEISLLRFYKQVSQQPTQDKKWLMSQAAQIFRRKTNNTMRFYTAVTFANSFLFALAISDLVNNTLILVPLLSSVNLNLLGIGFICKSLAFLKHACRYLSAMFTLMYTFQRCVAVSNPLSVFRRQTPMSAFKSGKIILALVASASLIYSYTFIAFNSAENSSQCGPVDQRLNLLRILENTVDLVLGGIVPIVGILGLNLITFYRLIKIDKTRQNIGQEETVDRVVVKFHKRRRDGLNFSEFASIQSSFASHAEFNIQAEGSMDFGQFQRRRDATRQPVASPAAAFKLEKIRMKQNARLRRGTRTLVIVSLTFVAFNLPPRLIQLYRFLGGGSSYLFVLDKQVATKQGSLAIEDVFEEMCPLSFTINFFLYFVMAKKFRNALKSLFIYLHLSVYVLFN